MFSSYGFGHGYNFDVVGCSSGNTGITLGFGVRSKAVNFQRRYLWFLLCLG